MPDRLNKGDWVLVTGVTGLLGASTANELVSRGFNVRGVVRDLARAQPLKEKIDGLYGPGHFELVLVEDAAKPGAFRDALEGTAGLIHLAADLGAMFSPDATVESSIASTTDMSLGILRSAVEVPTIRAAVLTSSSIAHAAPEYGKEIFVDVDVYNEQLVELAYSLPVGHPMRSPAIYGAGKTRAEQAVWKWVDEVKPPFAVNTILPHMTLGRPFNPYPGRYSTSSGLAALFDGTGTSHATNPMLAFFGPWVVDVVDQAIIHVAALLAPDVDRRKLWAAGHPGVTLNEVLRIWRAQWPDKQLVPDFPEAQQTFKFDLDNSFETQLLKRYAGREWLPLEQTIIDNVAYLA